ncbi:MAG: hypothetical protein R3283_09595 [Balneolaceae bacterium]|nr:hypothetical protein [Balneolaceae bacterium]
MITLFRRIRHKLIDSGSATKYLLYAAGEILLVVIGILIALQVNNWNEEKRLNQQIDSTLLVITEDLIRDEEAINETMLFLEGDLAAQENIIRTLEQGDTFAEQTYRDLGRVMLLRRTELTDNGYNLLKELGMNNLNDTELRDALYDYYERKAKIALREIQDDKVEFENTWIEYVREHFRIWNFGEQAIPNDGSFIRNHSYFLTMIRMNLNNRESTLNAHEEALSANRELIQTIESRLDR